MIQYTHFQKVMPILIVRLWAIIETVFFGLVEFFLLISFFSGPIAWPPYKSYITSIRIDGSSALCLIAKKLIPSKWL